MRTKFSVSLIFLLSFILMLTSCFVGPQFVAIFAVPSEGGKVRVTEGTLADDFNEWTEKIDAIVGPLGVVETKVEALPSEGWHFVGWYRTDVLDKENKFTLDSTELIHTYAKLPSGTKIEARFERDKTMYELFLESVPPEGGSFVIQGVVQVPSKSFTGEFEEGTELQITAQPSETHDFDGFYGYQAANPEIPELLGVDASYYTFINEDKRIEVRFREKAPPAPEMHELQVETQPPEGGSFVIEGITGQVDTYTGEFEEGTELQITAHPSETHDFDGFYGYQAANPGIPELLGVDASYYTFINEDKRIEVRFREKEPPALEMHELQVETQPPEGGSFIIQGVVEVPSKSFTGEFEEGTELQLTAQPSETHDFVGYFQNDSLLSNEQIFNLIMDGDKNIEVRFQEKAPPTETFELKVNTEPNNGGNFFIPVVDTSPRDWYTGNFNSGEVIRLEAEADQGFRFAGYFDTAGTQLHAQNVFNLLMDSDKDIVVKFENQ